MGDLGTRGRYRGHERGSEAKIYECVSERARSSFYSIYTQIAPDKCILEKECVKTNETVGSAFESLQALTKEHTDLLQPEPREILSSLRAYSSEDIIIQDPCWLFTEAEPSDFRSTCETHQATSVAVAGERCQARRGLVDHERIALPLRKASPSLYSLSISEYSQEGLEELGKSIPGKVESPPPLSITTHKASVGMQVPEPTSVFVEEYEGGSNRRCVIGPEERNVSASPNMLLSCPEFWQLSIRTFE